MVPATNWTSSDNFAATTLTKSVNEVDWTTPGGDATAYGNVSIRAANALTRGLSPAECYELTIAVNCAVNAYSRNIKRAKLRLFTRTGREITGGPLFELLRQPSPGIGYRRWIDEIICWRLIAGEWAVRVLMRDEDRYPQGFPVLTPTRLFVEKPRRPNGIIDVVQWRYEWPDGSKEIIRSDRVIYEGLFNPNPNSIRGLSPLVTGSVTASTQYQTGRYNLGFFQNGGIPSHLLILPDGVGRKQREEFQDRYLAEYGTYGNNAHKVMVVAGKDVKVESLEQPFQDGAFMELTKWNDEKIGQLYRVPPIEMFNLQKTRFDTAAEERRMFADSTLIPFMEDLSEIFQNQIIDPFFGLSEYSTEKPRLTKSMDNLYAKALAERQQSNIIVMLDPDTLPIMGEIKMGMTEQAMKFREAFDASAEEAIEYVGIDLPQRPERKDVWIKNDRLNITNPAMNAQLVPGVKGEGNEDKKEPADKEGETDNSAPKPSSKSLKSLMHKLRRLTLSGLDNNALWTLEEADALVGDEHRTRTRLVRFQLQQLRKSVSGDELKDAVREYFSIDASLVAA